MEDQQQQVQDKSSDNSNFARWKKFWGRSTPAEKKPASIESVGSFSQSNDFQTIFDTEDPEKSKSEEEEEVYLVKQKHGYFSIAFSAGQLLVLIAMMSGCGVAPMNINPMIGPYPDALSYWGGKNAVNIIDDGEWWRLITPIMLHAGVIHLLCNVAVQVETGAFFEREWGSTKWLIIYIVSAIGSTALSVIKMPGAISVGSSGAVMGLFGAKLAEVIVRFCDRDKTTQGRIAHQVRKEQCAGVTCSVIVVMLFSFIPYVDWSAHLGGLAAGFCTGMVLFAIELKKLVGRIIWTAIGVIITCVYFSVILTEMYSGNVDPPEELRDVCEYYKQFFDDYDCKCMRN
eukprot:scaffold2141_cov120-Cylindrotheca_fusiformis.AAC.19